MPKNYWNFNTIIAERNHSEWTKSLGSTNRLD